MQNLGALSRRTARIGSGTTERHIFEPLQSQIAATKELDRERVKLEFSAVHLEKLKSESLSSVFNVFFTSDCE